VYVALARALAQVGIPSLRLDTSGKGESARKDLSRAAALEDDLAQVSDFLRAHGHYQLVLAGICSGADDALELAAPAARCPRSVPDAAMVAAPDADPCGCINGQ